VKKLNAYTREFTEGSWIVTVIDVETEEEIELIVEADTEKDAAFKAMEYINEQ